MIFSIGAVIFFIAYLWYSQSEYYADWRDALQFAMLVIGGSMMIISLLILAWQYLP